ncbi:HU family DNA-binding protein [Porphyromonas gingivalis]|uniref:HU family DNA-binding protein n=1 Tax=Porphyromonas gingivalis TaxID=837 RepID=UPI000974F9D5|nr:HU family DNA-binding protein [Porphyromonas gingivalis]SJL21703.1 DNA-binding protein [Porphyromonas gingivalis]
MSILYNFRKMPPRPDQNEPEEAEGRLFAQAIIQRQYTTEDLCRDISDRSSFSSGDITGLMIAMEELIFEYLASGYSFRLGNIGTLSAKVKSRGVRDKKEIRSGSVQAVDINFRSTPQAKRRMRSMSVKRGPSFGQSCPKADEEERYRLAAGHIRHRGYIRIADYSTLSGLLKHSATRELNRWVQEGKLATRGLCSHKVYVLPEPTSQNSESID